MQATGKAQSPLGDCRSPGGGYITGVDHEQIAEQIRPEYSHRARRASIAIAALVIVCVFWGYSFPVMQFATRAFDRHVLKASAGDWDKFASRALFNGVRYGLAAVLYGILTIPRQRGFNWHDLAGGTVIGILFAGGMIFQVTGLRWVVPSVSGFITALPVVFAPFAQAVILKRPVGRMTWFAVGLAMVGMLLLSGPKPEAANTVAIRPPIPYLGEMMTLAAAIIFTAEIISVHHFGQNSSPMRLTLIMLTATSLTSFVFVVVLWRPLNIGTAAMSGLLHDGEMAWTMLTLIVVSSVLPLHLMNIFQPRVSPAIASVVYCTEPLFSTVFSLMFATEQLTVMTVIGGSAVVASVLAVSQPEGKR